MELTATKYKETEVGFIPEDWGCVKMGEVGNTIIGLTYSPKDVADYGTLVLRSSNVQKNQLAYENNVFVEMELPQRVIVKENDILICVRNGSKQLIGKCALIDKKAEGYAFGAFMSIYRSDFSKYIFYTFQSNIIQKQIDETMGATINQLTNRNLFEFKLPLPREPEQKAIAKVLSDTDALIQALEKKIDKKKLIKKGASQQLLFGKNRLKGFETDRKSKKSVFGDIPDDWDVKPLPDVFNYIHGKAHEQFIVDNGSFKVVNSKFVSSEGTIVKYSSNNFCPAKKGDILTVLSDLPNGKALAKTFFVEDDNRFAVNQRICIWRSKSDDPLFMYYFMNRHKFFLKFDDGVTQTHILNHHINECPVLVPQNIDEQIAIGNALHVMDEEIKILEQKLAKYQLAKQGMMQQLLTGKIRLI